MASKQADAASSERMSAIYANWKKHSRFDRSAVPPVPVELWTFADEIVPQLQKCGGEYAQELECWFLSDLVPYMLFEANMPVRPYWPVALKQDFIPYGVPAKKVCADNSRWVGTGCRFETVLHDLNTDMALLGRSRWSFHPEETQKETEELDSTFGDILPVRRTGESISLSIALVIMERMSMEDLYMALYDTPELVHEFFGRLADDYMLYLDEMENRGLILPAVGDEPLLEGSYCFADGLPSEGSGIKTSQAWGYMDAEEFNDVSPDMFKEFIVEHYSRLAAKFGAVSRGCPPFLGGRA